MLESERSIPNQTTTCKETRRIFLKQASCQCFPQEVAESVLFQNMGKFKKMEIRGPGNIPD